MVIARAGLVGGTQNARAVGQPELARHDDADGRADVHIQGHFALGPSDLSLKLRALVIFPSQTAASFCA